MLPSLKAPSASWVAGKLRHLDVNGVYCWSGPTLRTPYHAPATKLVAVCLAPI